MGVLSISIGTDRIAVSVAALGTPTTVAEALAEAINNEESLPVTALAEDGVISLTAKDKGTLTRRADASKL